MLKIGTKYWFRIIGNLGKEVNLKGEVIEENDFLFKIKRDNGLEEILTFKQIISLNEVKEPTFEKANELSIENVEVKKL